LAREDRLVPIGKVGRPHGLDGAFVVERASEDDRRWQVGATILVDGEPATITLARRVGGSRRAIGLDRPVRRGAELAIRVSDLPSPDPDAHYAFELVGLMAVDEDGRDLGQVVDVLPGVANDNLELADRTLVPLIEDAIRMIDVEGGRVVVARGFLA
jgi:16S rRNA processing protein RimM